MADTVYSLDELNKPAAKAAQKPQSQVKGKVVPLTALGGVADPSKPAESKPGFVSDSIKTIKKAGQTYLKDPLGTFDSAAYSVVKGGIEMINLSLSGVGALAKSMAQPIKVDPRLTPQQQASQNLDQSLQQFTQNQQRIEKALTRVNDSPPTEQEQAMDELLGIIPNGTKAAGDTVYEKTGSALAATGALALTTLLTLNPEIAGKVMSKAGEYTKGKPANATAAAFDELAAQAPEAATKVADHINQVDPLTAKKLHKRIQKYIDASEDDLNLIGRNAADAAIKDLEGNFDEIRKQGLDRPSPNMIRVPPPDTSAKPQVQRGRQLDEEYLTKAKSEALAKQRMMLSVTPERAASTIRETAKQGVEAIENATKPAAKLKIKLKPTVNPVEPPSNKPGVSAEPAIPKPDDIVYFHSGIPVTRESVAAAFKFVGEALDHVPGVAIAKGKMGGLYNSYIENFNPEAKGPAARIAGSAIAQNFFKRAEIEHQIWEKGKERRTYWLKVGKDAQVKFLKDSEKGTKLSNPEQEQARIGYKNWVNRIYAQDVATWAKDGKAAYDPLDNYVPRSFEDAAGVRRWAQKKFGTKWNDPRFVKERGYQFLQDAMDAGFTLKTTNPEEVMQNRQLASDITSLRSELLRDFESKGIAVRAKEGETRPPDQSFAAETWRSPTGARYWVKEELGPIMKNAWDSESLWQQHGIKGDLFRAYMGAKNKIIPIKLAASLFHPMHVMHIDAAADFTRGAKELVSGSKPVVTRVKDFMLNAAMSLPFATSTVRSAPIVGSSSRMGYPLLKVFQGKMPFEALSEADKEAYHTLAESGLVPTRPRQEMSNDIQKLKDAWAKKSLTSAVFHLPFAGMQAATGWIYGEWIPALKIAALVKDAKVIRETNPEMSALERQVALRDAARKVEARYGEMNYESMFMNKMYKDIGVATNLSLGWNLGLLDQYVGGSIDLGRAIAEKGSVKEKVSKGLLDRPVFAAYYITSALVLGGLMHKWFTGKNPEQLIDYTHPESGEKDAHGMPIRLNTMFYTREFEGLAKHIEQQGAERGLYDFAANKGSGMIEMIHAAWTGINGLGDNIRNENDPAYKQLEQTLLYTFADIDPIAIEAINKSAGGWQDAKSVGLSALGFTPAGKYISQTVTEGRIENDYNKYERAKETPYDRVQLNAEYQHLGKLYDTGGEAYDQALAKATEKFQLTPKDVARMEKNFRKADSFNPSIYMFKRLQWPQQKALLDQMSEEERAKYLPVSNKDHLRSKYVAPGAAE